MCLSLTLDGVASPDNPSGSKLIGAAALRLCSDNDHKRSACSRMTAPELTTDCRDAPSTERPLLPLRTLSPALEGAEVWGGEVDRSRLDRHEQ